MNLETAAFHFILMLPDGIAATSASLIFSTSGLIVGGGLYGAWTNLSNENRLKCTINAELIFRYVIST